MKKDKQGVCVRACVHACVCPSVCLSLRLLITSGVMWSPYTQSLINNLEAIQRKVARFVCNNYYRYSSVSEMLQQLEWPTLECQCLEARATMMYKIINNLIHVDQRYLSYNLRNTRSHSLHLYHLPTRIDAYGHSFYPSLIRIWNNLPECVISSTTVDLLKYRLCGLETI